MTKGNSSSVVAVRLPDAVVARIKTIARRKRQTVNEILKRVILGYVVGNYYSEEQVAELCELEPLAWRKTTDSGKPTSRIDKFNTSTTIPQESVTTEFDFSKVGRNDPCPCGSGKKYKKCHGA